MNKEYNKSNVEIKAKELLLPMRTACPDNVWQELNYHLNESDTGQNQWPGKLSKTSKIVVICGTVVCVTSLLIWNLSGKIRNLSNDKSAGTTMLKNAPAPVKKDVPQPQPKPVAKADTTHIVKPAVVKDSVKVPKNNPPVVNNVVASQSVAPMVLTPAQKHWQDSVLTVRRNYIMLLHHRRDSMALAKRTKGNKRAIPHDSATVKADTNW